MSNLKEYFDKKHGALTPDNRPKEERAREAIQDMARDLRQTSEQAGGKMSQEQAEKKMREIAEKADR